MRLLVSEEDPMIGDSIVEILRAEGYVADWVRDCQAVFVALGADVCDLLLLDLGWSRRDGLKVLCQYRVRGGMAPVLIITTRDSTADQVHGLAARVDDQLVNRLELEGLFARMRALRGRSAGRTQPDIVHRGVRLRVATHEAFVNDQPLPLLAREFSLLSALFGPPERIMSKTLLDQKRYGWNEEVESNTVDVYVRRLRKKLDADFIRTVRGVGYFAPSQS